MNEHPTFESQPWHVAPDLLRDYAALGLDMARAASVEQHLLSCDPCRVALSSLFHDEGDSPANLGALWLDVIDAVDQPRSGPFGSLLRRLGVPDHRARVVAAAPSMHLSWLASVLLVLAFAVGNARRPHGSDALLLILAPLIPLAGIGAAYGIGGDPLGEVAKAAPLLGSRVFLHRSLAVLFTAIPLTLVASLILRLDGFDATGWLLPSLGLVGATLALSTWVSPAFAAILAGSTWLLIVVGVWARSARIERLGLEDTVIFRPTGQVAFAALALAGAVIFAGRMGHLDRPVDAHGGAW